MELIIMLLGIFAAFCLVFLLISLSENSADQSTITFTISCIMAFILTWILWVNNTEVKHTYSPLSTVTINEQVYKGYYRGGEFRFAPNPQHQFDYVVTTYPRTGSLENVTYTFIAAKDTIHYQNNK